ncbi:hypothetical protein [Stenotrophomonas maltophilia]|uniref:hypothetical protein n=1 Tax=Stenotrophomonas maltophilia TaxID=40324 RepID=UPI0040433D01
MADQLLTAVSPSASSAPGSEARYVALNRSHGELHSVAPAPDRALGSQLDSDAVNFGCVREDIIPAAGDGKHETVAIVKTSQGSMKATSSHVPSAIGDVLHCTAECRESTASSLAADPLLTAATVHLLALVGILLVLGALWIALQGYRAARAGLRWCWRRCAHGY